MKLHLITVGNKLPNWLQIGVDDYKKRLGGFIGVAMCELPASKRHKNPSDSDIDSYKKSEAKAILSAKKGTLWLLDVKGKSLSTEQLAHKLQQAMGQGQDVSLVIGGVDGVSDELVAAADFVWSLSDLTLPHPLVRVVVVEQLYRAMSLLHNHPYHRA